MSWPFDFHLVWHILVVLHVGIVLISLYMPSEINQKHPEQPATPPEMFNAIV